MFAIIRTGGKQYRVQPGDTLRVEKLDKKLGESFDVTEVLMVGGEKAVFGTPTVSGAKVTVTVTRHAKEAKITVFKKKRRQGYRRTIGHRQNYTELFVQGISAEGQSAKADKKPQIVDPAKKAARLAARAEKLQASGKSAVVDAKKKKAAVKVAAKSKAAKRAAPKAAKKKPAAKTGAKKAAKK